MRRSCHLFSVQPPKFITSGQSQENIRWKYQDHKNPNKPTKTEKQSHTKSDLGDMTTKYNVVF